jgi:ADP-heptose:LPS heptosyltransferase
VVLHVGANDPRRRWPPDRFGAVGDELAAAGASVAVSAGPDEAALADEVVRLMRSDARSVAGQLGLGGLLGLLAGAGLLVANDTGPLHLARAVRTPTVGIYWCGNLATFGPVTHATNRVAVSWQVHCRICGALATPPAPRCPHDVSFVTAVTTAEVLDLALDLLEHPIS